MVVGLTLVFGAVMIGLVRPIAARLTEKGRIRALA